MARGLLLQSHSEQIAEYSGEQFELVMAQIARENELKESLGLAAVAEEEEDTPEPDPGSQEEEEAQPAPAPAAADPEAEG